MKVSAREVLVMKEHFELVLSAKAFACPDTSARNRHDREYAGGRGAPPSSCSGAQYICDEKAETRGKLSW